MLKCAENSRNTYVGIRIQLNHARSMSSSKRIPKCLMFSAKLANGFYLGTLVLLCISAVSNFHLKWVF